MVYGIWYMYMYMYMVYVYGICIWYMVYVYGIYVYGNEARPRGSSFGPRVPAPRYHIHIPYTYTIYIYHIHIPYTIYIYHKHIPYSMGEPKWENQNGRTNGRTKMGEPMREPRVLGGSGKSYLIASRQHPLQHSLFGESYMNQLQ